MSGGRRRLGRRAETAIDGGVNAGERGEMEVSTSDGHSTLPVRDPGGQLGSGLMITGSDCEEATNFSVVA